VSRYIHELGLQDQEARYELRVTDLNGDGNPEILVYLWANDVCGSGGCNLMILSPAGTSFEVLADTTVTRLPIRVLASKTNGWHDIGVWVAGGGILRGYEAKVSFRRDKYQNNPTVAPAQHLQPGAAGIVQSKQPLRAN
jgi:hypothetical protein